jgi:RsiW-degrading membrane proteinase PrsW (M82 family)
MNIGSALLWGFAATLVLTTLLSGSRALGLTRMDVPFLVGTMFTGNRDRAKWIGFAVHLLNGWIFAFIYFAAFHSTGWKTPWFGALIGLVHILFVLTAGMLILPSFHPRMASEQHGPNPARQLEPPGFFALNYGRQTPISSIVAHLLFGAILGFFYQF